MLLVEERPPAISWRDRLEPITETPNTWMRVREYPLPKTAYSVVSMLRSGAKHLPPGDWKFRAHKIDGQGVIFARFVVTSENPAMAAG